MGRRDKFTKEKRSEIMSKIKSSDTGIEVTLKSLLRKRKIRYLNRRMAGSPDIVLRNYKIAIFCDGDFWHGRRFKSMLPKLNKYWKDKIRNNMKRDRKCNRILKSKGWRVLRFWGGDIERRPEKCLRRIEREIEQFSTG